MNIVSNQDGFTYILALTIVIIMGIMLGMVGQTWKTISQRELEEEMIFRGSQVAEIVYQGALCKNSQLATTVAATASSALTSTTSGTSPGVNNTGATTSGTTAAGATAARTSAAGTAATAIATIAPQYMWLVNSPNGTVLSDLVIGKEDRCSNGKNRKFRLRVSATLDPLTNKQWQIVKPVGDEVHFAGVASDSSKEPMRQKFKGIFDSESLDFKLTYSEWHFTGDLMMPVPVSMAVVK